MGTPSKLLNGVYGTVGPLVGTSWRGRNFIRSKPLRKKNRTFSAEQLDQQAKFRVVVEHMKAMSDFIGRSFTDVKGERTEFNAAMSYAISKAITGTYPDYQLDFSKILVSRGRLLPPKLPAAVANGTIIQFTWTSDIGPSLSPRDKALLVVYCPALQVSYWDIVSSRSTGTAQLNADYFTGQVVHTYLAFLTEKGDRSSYSAYTGQFTL